LGGARLWYNSRMVQATFDLPEETLASLEAWAAERGLSASLALQSAITEFLSRKRMPGDEWGQRWNALREKVAAQGVPGSPEEIEADIRAAIEEVRADERAARSH
jgi:hypothetical protein